MFSKRMNIFVGHFGSGKTEVAINFAIELNRLSYKTVIVDADIVNPFFRTADVKNALEELSIRVITPVYANKNIEVPAIPAEINSVFQQKGYKVVFDVGGDDLGAKILARFSQEISEDDYEVFFVINTRRPETDSVDKILQIVDEIEKSSKFKVSKLINNTNILSYTKVDDILKGQHIIEQAAKELHIDIAFTSVLDEMEGMEKIIDLNLFRMKKYIKLPWD